MATCPDCGSVIMEGDPYCTHCGAHLVWGDEAPNLEKPTGGLADIISREIIASPEKKESLALKVIELVKTRDTTLRKVNIDGDNATFVFERNNGHVKTTVTCLFRYLDDSPRVFESFHEDNDYSNLIRNYEFQRSVKNVESETDNRYSHISGGFSISENILTGDITFGDKCDVSVFFRTPKGGYNQYHLDFETMALTSAMDRLLSQLKDLK